ncbi:hypothetical protein BN863_15510 [Formosa agariphila KMM 3901]|uniref:Uncharacterized protein n=2 Tax=Formosa TaxID=225842 RepID=T2KLE6_FORAG|nr:hypothetical protein BN863_15510 [Formosa agariphila KMM 3901]
MGMLRHGVTVFFDLKGKEKEDIAMTYPIIEPIRMSMQPEADRGNGREASFQSEADIKQMKAQINTLVTTDFPEEALFKLNDSKQNFNVLLNGIGISATYSYNQEENILTYKLSIPKAKLKTKAKDDFSKLMIGVQTAKPEQSKRNENTTMGNEMGSRGGGRGNRQAGGGRGGSRGGGQRPGGDSERKPQGIDFWFEAHL